MNGYYDLHIHSCLSPCADDEMTPNNIVNMAMLSGLNIIALTDHNSCKNCEAAIDVGKKAGICVVPGMELTTSEEIHVICLFPAIENALGFQEYIENNRVNINNREDIYGQQLIMNSYDEIIGKEEHLLIMASNLSIINVEEIVDKFHGVSFPAHIEREGNGIISVLGEIPPETSFNAFEIKNKALTNELVKKHKSLQNMPIFYNSDSHYLPNIKERNEFITLDELSAECLVKTIREGLFKTC